MTPGDDRQHVGRSEAWMDRRRLLEQQSVVGHGVEHAALPEQQHQGYGAEGQDSAYLDDRPPSALLPYLHLAPGGVETVVSVQFS